MSNVGTSAFKFFTDPFEQAYREKGWIVNNPGQTTMYVTEPEKKPLISSSTRKKEKEEEETRTAYGKQESRTGRLTRTILGR